MSLGKIPVIRNHIDLCAVRSFGRWLANARDQRDLAPEVVDDLTDVRFNSL